MPPLTKIMPTPKEDAPKTSGPTPAQNCRVELQPDGKLVVSFLVDELATRRLRSRAGAMDLATYLWENILKRAVVDHVY